MASKVPNRRYDLAEVIKSELQKAKPIELVVGDKTFTIDSPIFWPDSIYDASNPESARVVLGDQYDDWCATEIDVDGRMVHLNANIFWAQIAQINGATVPESDASTSS